MRGDVKIFDFGLARIMPEGGNPYSSKYEMSGAGSPRYMAPECLAGEDYNLKADVYTFAIVMWQMLTGETPYSFIRSRDQLLYYVIEEQGRPEIDDCWPANIKRMLTMCFHADHVNRPVSPGILCVCPTSQMKCLPFSSHTCLPLLSLISLPSK